MDSVIERLAFLESRNNPKLIGDNGKAVGILQIWNVVLDDVNKHYGTKYIPSDRYNVHKSKQIAKLYLRKYGKGKTEQQIVRIWNGGPDGHRQSSTIKYWREYERYIRK